MSYYTFIMPNHHSIVEDIKA